MGDDEQNDYRDFLADLATNACVLLESKLTVEPASPVLYARAEALWDYLRRCMEEVGESEQCSTSQRGQLSALYFIAEFAFARALDATQGRTASVLEQLRTEPEHAMEFQKLLAPGLHEKMFQLVSSLGPPVQELLNAGPQLKKLAYDVAVISIGSAHPRAAGWAKLMSTHLEDMGNVCLRSGSAWESLTAELTLRSALRRQLRPRPVIGRTIRERNATLDDDLDRLRGAGAVPLADLAQIFYGHEPGTPESRLPKLRARLARIDDRFEEATGIKKKKSATSTEARVSRGSAKPEKSRREGT